MMKVFWMCNLGQNPEANEFEEKKTNTEAKSVNDTRKIGIHVDMENIIKTSDSISS